MTIRKRKDSSLVLKESLERSRNAMIRQSVILGLEFHPKMSESELRTLLRGHCKNVKKHVPVCGQ